MKIPLRYNFSSLWVRRTGTLMTVAGISFTVTIFITMMSLIHGLESTFVDTGHDNHLMVLRQGSLSEINSYYDRDLLPTIRFLPGIARSSSGEPLVVGEHVVIINHPKIGGESSNIMLRGTSDVGFALRPEVKIVDGRPFRGGLREIVVSQSLSNRFANLKLGDSIHFARSSWKVVGIFSAGGTAYDSEIWADYEDISQDWDRPSYSCVLLAAESASAALEIQRRIADDRRLHLQAIPQKKYYGDQTTAAAGVQALGYFVALAMGIGAAFAAMNTMYGAVLSRSKEVGTLRALGFRRRHILASFLAESIILGLIGGFVGCLLALPIHGISSATANMATFSEVMFQFRITPGILLRGILFAALVCAIGGYLPARRAARVQLIDILRD